MNEQENDTVKNNSKMTRIIIFVIYLALLFLIFLLLTNSGMELFLAILLLLFFLLIMIGPIFYGFKRPYYYRLFHRDRTKSTEKKPTNTKSNIPKPYNYEVKFKKPLIRKCPSCGMTIANFVKKCPQCGTQLGFIF